MSFDEQPDGDIHGECAAEIRRLEGEVTIWRNSAEAQTERLKEAEGAIAEGKKPDLVPGVVHCARCNFRLNRVTLYMGNGAIGPGGSETEQCPNGCGPMWPVTWKQEAQDAYKTAESQFERAKAAEDQLDACSPYLKEGEAVADALIRMQKEITTLRNAAMQQWADRGACDKEDAERYRWLLYHPKFAIYCFSYLPGQVSAEIDKSLAAQEAAG